jgi:hypothetical protein
MRLASVVAITFLVTATASAQSTYVGASLLGEFARYGGVDLDDDDGSLASIISVDDLSRSGEAVGFDLRIGRAITDRWGVEFTFARGGTIEKERTNEISFRLINVPVTFPPSIGFPDIEFEQRTELQHTTFDAIAFLRQELGSRINLAVLGGASFNRVAMEQSVRITDQRLAQFAPLLPFPPSAEVVSYGVGAVVGAEVIIDVGEHAAVTGGARLHGVPGGWLIRPAVGLRWAF